MPSVVFTRIALLHIGVVRLVAQDSVQRIVGHYFPQFFKTTMQQPCCGGRGPLDQCGNFRQRAILKVVELDRFTLEFGQPAEGSRHFVQLLITNGMYAGRRSIVSQPGLELAMRGFDLLLQIDFSRDIALIAGISSYGVHYIVAQDSAEPTGHLGVGAATALLLLPKGFEQCLLYHIGSVKFGPQLQPDFRAGNQRQIVTKVRELSVVELDFAQFMLPL